jgi:hypothetical protein
LPNDDVTPPVTKMYFDITQKNYGHDQSGGDPIVPGINKC